MLFWTLLLNAYSLVSIIDCKQYHKILPFALTSFVLNLNLLISHFITPAILNNLLDVVFCISILTSLSCFILDQGFSTLELLFGSLYFV